jgi:hypothetical protein
MLEVELHVTRRERWSAGPPKTPQGAELHIRGLEAMFTVQVADCVNMLAVCDCWLKNVGKEVMAL